MKLFCCICCGSGSVHSSINTPAIVVVLHEHRQPAYTHFWPRRAAPPPPMRYVYLYCCSARTTSMIFYISILLPPAADISFCTCSILYQCNLFARPLPAVWCHGAIFHGIHGGSDPFVQAVYTYTCRRCIYMLEVPHFVAALFLRAAAAAAVPARSTLACWCSVVGGAACTARPARRAVFPLLRPPLYINIFNFQPSAYCCCVPCPAFASCIPVCTSVYCICVCLPPTPTCTLFYICIVGNLYLYDVPFFCSVPP